MKRICYVLLLTLGASASASTSRIMHSMAEGTRHKHITALGVHPWRWGPQNCAELFRSEVGTCVIRTNCNGVDIDNFEFAFDCESSGEIQRHSFGIGGFDDEDDFDTAVNCTECLPVGASPTKKFHHAHHEVSVEKVSSAPAVHMPPIHQEVPMVGAKLSSTRTSHKVVPKSHTHHEVVVVGVKLSSAGQAELKAKASRKAHAETKAEASSNNEHIESPPKNVTKYGPGDCISTWRDSKTGTCIVQTSCAKENTDDHMFGLICKKGEGNSSLTRHLFGRDTFAAEETFDTLITCDECLSTGYVKEDEEKPVWVLVKDLAGAVGQVKDGMKALKADVTELNAHVFNKQEDAKQNETAAAASPKANVSLSEVGIDEHVTIHQKIQHKLRGQNIDSSKQKKPQDDADDPEDSDDDTGSN